MADIDLGTEVDTDPVGTDEDSERSRRVGGLVVSAILAVIILWILLNSAFVPNTVGMSAKRSKALLSAARFGSEVTTVSAQGRPAGRVIGQAPSAGLRLVFWPVHVTVTSGAWGGPKSPAGQYDLGDYALDVRNPDKDRQVPRDPEEVKPLFTPNLQEAPVMPNVQNLPRAAALRQLRALGLRVALRTGPSTTNVAKGRIFYQDPAPGLDLPRDRMATLWVSLRPFNLLEYGDRRIYERPGHDSSTESP